MVSHMANPLVALLSAPPSAGASMYVQFAQQGLAPSWQNINNITLLVFDDGNTRREFDNNADSRGQEWILNERNRIATLVVNADVGNYSSFLGSSERLSNGDLAFTSGSLYTNQIPAGQSIEVLPNGTRVYVQQMSEVLADGIGDILKRLASAAPCELHPGRPGTLTL